MQDDNFREKKKSPTILSFTELVQTKLIGFYFNFSFNKLGPHQLPLIANTPTDWQLPDHGKDVNQNPPEKGLKTPEFPACCHGC